MLSRMDPTEPIPGQVPPPRKKPVSALTIVVAVVGVMALVCVGAIGAGVFWVKGKAEKLVAQAADGGLAFVTESPSEVRTELAGPRSNYVGSWRSDQGSSLDIEEDGALSYSKVAGRGTTTRYSLPIAAFDGDDIVCKAMLTLVIKVTEPPQEVGGRWQMVADGTTFYRQ
jgi:hypothetical protein